MFSSNVGFEKYCSEQQSSQTAAIVEAFDNPEDINSSPETAPSKRLKTLIPDYDKVIMGNLLVLEIGIDAIMERCPSFSAWLKMLVDRCG